MATESAQLGNLLESAYGLLCNVSEGDLGRQRKDWFDAFVKFRTEYFKAIKQDKLEEGFWLMKHDDGHKSRWYVDDQGRGICLSSFHGWSPAKSLLDCGRDCWERGSENNEQLKQDLAIAQAKLQLIEDAARADHADLQKMRDGTKLTREGLVMTIKYLREDIADAKMLITKALGLCDGTQSWVQIASIIEGRLKHLTESLEKAKYRFKEQYEAAIVKDKIIADCERALRFTSANPAAAGERDQAIKAAQEELAKGRPGQ